MREWKELPRGSTAPISRETFTISVRKNGVITWNRALGAAMGYPKYVRLFCCDGALGLKPAESAEAGVFPVNATGISARAALKAVSPTGELPPRSVRREAAEEDGVFVIEILDLFDN